MYWSEVSVGGWYVECKTCCWALQYIYMRDLRNSEGGGGQFTGGYRLPPPIWPYTMNTINSQPLCAFQLHHVVPMSGRTSMLETALCKMVCAVSTSSLQTQTTTEFPASTWSQSATLLSLKYNPLCLPSETKRWETEGRGGGRGGGGEKEGVCMSQPKHGRRKRKPISMATAFFFSFFTPAVCYDWKYTQEFTKAGPIENILSPLRFIEVDTIASYS